MKIIHNDVFDKINVISNKFRFKILEITQHEEPTISELSSRIQLSYTKCADYTTLLKDLNLVEKIKDGKNIRIKSKIKLSKDKIEF